MEEYLDGVSLLLLNVVGLRCVSPSLLSLVAGTSRGYCRVGDIPRVSVPVAKMEERGLPNVSNGLGSGGLRAWWAISDLGCGVSGASRCGSGG